MVHLTGLEPALRMEIEPHSIVSANSTTDVYFVGVLGGSRTHKFQSLNLIDMPILVQAQIVQPGSGRGKFNESLTPTGTVSIDSDLNLLFKCITSPVGLIRNNH